MKLPHTAVKVSADILSRLAQLVQNMFAHAAEGASVYCEDGQFVVNNYYAS